MANSGPSGAGDIAGASKETTIKSNLPWVEKYRPYTLNDVISHEDIISTIRRFIQEDQLPHLLFYGPPGTGKTSTALACAKRMFKPPQFGAMVLELNASDDRGIDVVRGQILNFASTKAIFCSGFKLIILDEADSMTIDAQNALRRIIEKYTANVRFCIICNYLNKIIPALQSRCTRFRFGPLQSLEILPRLRYIAKQEKVNITESGKSAILALSGGDMRQIINILESTATAHDVVNEETVYTCVARPLKNDISNIMIWLLNDTFEAAYEKIQDLETKKGLALTDILTEVHVFVHKVELPRESVVQLLIEMSEIEYRLASGALEDTQLSAFIIAFHVARDSLPKETDI